MIDPTGHVPLLVSNREAERIIPWAPDPTRDWYPSPWQAIGAVFGSVFAGAFAWWAWDAAVSLIPTVSGEATALGGTADAWGSDSFLSQLNSSRASAPKAGSLGNVATREWYLAQEARISGMIDADASAALRARQAFEARNLMRSLARDAMQDTKLAQELMAKEPNWTWEQLVQKYLDKGLRGDDLWNAIIKAAQKSREAVNQVLGVGGK